MTKELDDKEIERLLTWIKSLKGGPSLDDRQMLESEARFLANLEYLESRIPLEPLELDEAKKASPVTRESDLFELERYAEKLAERINAGDYEAARDFAEEFFTALRNQKTRDANRPTGRKIAKDTNGDPVTVKLVAARIDTYRAQGVEESSIVGALAEELGVSKQTIYRRWKDAKNRGLIANPTTNAKE